MCSDARELNALLKGTFRSGLAHREIVGSEVEGARLGAAGAGGAEEDQRIFESLCPARLLLPFPSIPSASAKAALRRARTQASVHGKMRSRLP